MSLNAKLYRSNWVGHTDTILTLFCMCYDFTSIRLGPESLKKLGAQAMLICLSPF